MVLVQAKESKYANQCARDACEIKTEIGKPYVYDTENKKAYCSKECAEMATGGKVVENGSSKKSSGTWTKPFQQLWRTPEEAAGALDIWHNKAIPMILDSCKKLFASDPQTKPKDEIILEMIQTYKEIFLGKMQGGSKN